MYMTIKNSVACKSYLVASLTDTCTMAIWMGQSDWSIADELPISEAISYSPVLFTCLRFFIATIQIGVIVQVCYTPQARCVTYTWFRLVSCTPAGKKQLHQQSELRFMDSSICAPELLADAVRGLHALTTSMWTGPFFFANNELFSVPRLVHSPSEMHSSLATSAAETFW